MTRQSRWIDLRSAASCCASLYVAALYFCVRADLDSSVSTTGAGVVLGYVLLSACVCVFVRESLLKGAGVVCSFDVFSIAHRM